PPHPLLSLHYALPIWLAGLGFAVRRLPETDYGDHLLADLPGPPGPRLMIVGHLDTVFPTGTGWGFRVDGPRAYGPGVVDMKGGLDRKSTRLNSSHVSI